MEEMGKDMEFPNISSFCKEVFSVTFGFFLTVFSILLNLHFGLGSGSDEERQEIRNNEHMMMLRLERNDDCDGKTVEFIIECIF